MTTEIILFGIVFAVIWYGDDISKLIKKLTKKENINNVDRD